MSKRGTTIELIRDILKHEMELQDDRIFYYNQDYVLPPDKGLWVIVAFQGSKLYSNRNSTYMNEQGKYVEKQDINTQEQINIHVMSYNLEALERKEEVPQAVASIYSQQLQMTQAFKIAPIMPILDVSSLEGPEINYRFDIMLTVLSYYEKIKAADYFDSIITKVTVANGAPANITKQFDPSVPAYDGT